MVLSRLSCLPQEVVEPPRNFNISGRFWAPGAPGDPPGGPPTPPENFETMQNLGKILMFSKNYEFLWSSRTKLPNGRPGVQGGLRGLEF